MHTFCFKLFDVSFDCSNAKLPSSDFEKAPMFIQSKDTENLSKLENETNKCNFRQLQIRG